MLLVRSTLGIRTTEVIKNFFFWFFLLYLSSLNIHPPLSDTLDDAIVICQTCRHGGHAVHILEWFLNEDGRRTHDVCPVVDCNCRCAEES